MVTQVTKHYNKPWQLLVSVCLTRLNVLRGELTGTEERYAQMLDTIEREQSVMNDYEHKKKLLQQAASINQTSISQKTKTKSKSEEEEKNITDASRQLAAIQDMEDMWAGDLARLKMASTTSERDSDRTWIGRRLDDTLHMVVEDETLLNERSIVYPYDAVQPGESLRQASEKIILKHGVKNEDVLYFSNAPIGVVKIRFNENEQRGEQYQGAKIFFTKAQLKSRDNLNITSSCSTKWLILNELEQNSHVDYFKRVKKFVN